MVKLWTIAVSLARRGVARSYVSVAVLLAGFGSVEPAPAVTIAVFTRSAVASLLTVPRTVRVSELPLPGERLAPVKLTLLPAEPLTPQLPVPVTAQAAVTPAIAAGTASTTLNPFALDGPAFVTTIV
jgi:hypothetical protein